MDSDRILHITSNDQHVVDHLADKLGVVDDVELLPGEELLAAHEAGEALQVEHLAMQIQQKRWKMENFILIAIIPIIIISIPLKIIVLIIATLSRAFLTKS